MIFSKYFILLFLLSYINCIDDGFYYVTDDFFIIDDSLTKINDDNIIIYFNASLSNGTYIYDKNSEIELVDNNKKNNVEDVIIKAKDIISLKISNLFSDYFNDETTGSIDNNDDSNPSKNDDGCDEGFIKNDEGECVCDKTTCNCGSDYSIKKGEYCYKADNSYCNHPSIMSKSK